MSTFDKVMGAVGRIVLAWTAIWITFLAFLFVAEDIQHVRAHLYLREPVMAVWASVGVAMIIAVITVVIRTTGD